jgi:hypothetical protein
VLAAQAGDVSAFEHLAERWHPRLLRHARRLDCPTAAGPPAPWGLGELLVAHLATNLRQQG